MIVKDFESGKLIKIGDAFDSRAKTLNTFYFLIFFIPAALILRSALKTDGEHYGIIFFSLVASVAFFIAAYRFINKALMSESLFVNKTKLCLLRKDLFKNKRTCYEISEISNFRHLAKPELTPHALAGNSFDYLGFQTEQKVISEMHGDKRLAFDYKGKIIQFGENIYSWDFDELNILIYETSGNDLRYTDDFGKNSLKED
jgi:hypothetical protein